jgi:hypothetical protein
MASEQDVLGKALKEHHPLQPQEIADSSLTNHQQQESSALSHLTRMSLLLGKPLIRWLRLQYQRSLPSMSSISSSMEHRVI